MNLPFFKKSSPASSPREYFFALEISHFLVKSAIWAVFNSRPQVLSVGESAPWDNQSVDSLIDACDRTLTAGADRLDKSGQIQPEKVILGLPADWIEGEKILPEKLKLLKSLFQKLSLSAVGFVVTTEAVTRYLQHQEGVPPTAILIGIWPTDLAVTLVRMGATVGTHSVKKSDHLVSDVVEGLSRFSHIDMLPSRMLLYNSGEDLEPIRQSLLAHPWQAPQTHLPFLHFPKIELLPADFSISSIALAGGSEVAQAAGLVPETEAPSTEAVPTPPAEPVSGADAFGFISDADIRQVQPLSSPPPSSSPVPPASHRHPFKFPRLHFPHPSWPLLPILPSTALVVALAVIAAAGLFTAWWFLPTATVTLYYQSRVLPLEISFAADTSLESVQLEPPVVPARLVEATVKDQKTIPTTGSKLIGDKAVGKATVINGTSIPKTFPMGTLITSPSGLKFTFDSSVEVASASGSADPNSYQPGSAAVNVTAAQIGTDSNLTAGTQFKIGSFSSLDYVAKNDAAFSGGSSRTVKAVAAGDITSLRTGLAASLRDQAQSKMDEALTSGSQLIPPSVTLTPTLEDFDHKADDIADDLTLKLSLSARGLSLSHSDLDPLIKSRLDPQTPAGFTAVGDYHFDITFGDTTGSRSTLSLTASVPLKPQFDADQILSAISGKSISAAQSYLRALPSVARVSLAVSPPLPSPLLTLPRVSHRITLKILPAEPQ